MSKYRSVTGLLVAGLFAACLEQSTDAAEHPFIYPTTYDSGRPIAIEREQELRTTIPPDGFGLPEGQGTFTEGRAIYASKCQACHGDALQGTAVGTALVGGRGSLSSDSPKKTIESFWPYATSVFSYIRNTMPTTAPGSLTDEESYALMAFILASANIISTDEVMHKDTLAKVRMPNRDGFVPDDTLDIEVPVAGD